MTKIQDQVPNSPSGAFDKAVDSLKSKLADPNASTSSVTSAFVRVLELLDTVLVETPVYAGMRAVVILNFRAVGHEFLEGRTGMGVRHGAIMDLTMHGMHVLAKAWT